MALVFYGLAVIYSATWVPPEQRSLVDDPFYRQVLFTVISFVMMLVIINMDYHFLSNLAMPCYLVAVGLLGATLAIGTAMHGAQRWLAGGAIQPSEVAKLLLIVAWAKWMADHEDQLKDLRYVAFSAGLLLVPFALTFKQPDLGTALVMGAIWLGMMIMAGMRVSHIIILLLTVVDALMIGMETILHDYQQNRFKVFIDPFSDGCNGCGDGYNIIQAMTAIGSGGLWGKGYLAGTQSQLQFLRVQHADFIFSVVAEELGFIGSVLLMILFVALLFRVLKIASKAGDTFGRLLAIGVASMIFFQFFINIGMNLKLVPAVGIPLPFISSGGSSLMTTLLSLGMLQSIIMRRRKIEFV